MNELTFKILVKETVEGKVLAMAPSLPACFAEAATVEEAVEQLKMTIGTVLREMLSKGEVITDDSDAEVYNLTIEVADKA